MGMIRPFIVAALTIFAPGASFAQICGNAVLEVGELCDDGALNSDLEPNACRTDCRTAYCQDSVTDQGEVQNRILLTERNFSPAELVSAANFLNQNYVGFDFEEIRGRLHAELKKLHGDLTSLMAAALQAGNEAFSGDKGQYVISGERNLLAVDDLASNMSRLRELFSLFDQRTQLASLLDLSQQAEGVQLFIGGESGLAPLDECSVVTAPYEIQGQVVGSVGVIGPTRMAYERVIPIVDVTAKLLSSALSQT
jgi:heat-inducible transcriptional repressor